MQCVLLAFLLALLTSSATSQGPAMSPLLDLAQIGKIVTEVMTEMGIYGLPGLPQPLLKAIVVEVLLRLPYSQQQQLLHQTPTTTAPVEARPSQQPPSPTDTSNSGPTASTVNNNEDGSQPKPGLQLGGVTLKNQHERDAICRQAPVTGLCRGYNPRFHFDPATQDCPQFVYGGCGGNRNRFETVAECMEFCKPPPQK